MDTNIVAVAASVIPVIMIMNEASVQIAMWCKAIVWILILTVLKQHFQCIYLLTLWQPSDNNQTKKFPKVEQSFGATENSQWGPGGLPPETGSNFKF